MFKNPNIQAFKEKARTHLSTTVQAFRSLSARVLSSGYGFWRAQWAGIRRAGAISTFGWTIESHDLGEDGVMQYAQWLHPKERAKKFSPQRLRAFRSIIEPGDFVVDVGAHTGDTSVLYSLAAGPQGLVLALEPNPYVFKVLKKNAQLNPDKTNIKPECWAATDKDGDIEFLYSDNGFCNGGNLGAIAHKRHGHHFKLKVQGKNLNSILQEQWAQWLHKFKFLKIDTEGYDSHVIQSLAPTIAQTKPVLLVEFLRKLNIQERQHLYDIIFDLGYDLYYFVEEGERIQGPPIERKGLLSKKTYDALCFPYKKQDRARDILSQ